MSLANDATERRLDMTAWAPEPVVEIEMAERGVKIVPPQQIDDPAAEPDAFRITGRTGERTRRFGKVVESTLLRVLGGFPGRRLRLRASLRVTLGECWTVERHDRRT